MDELPEDIHEPKPYQPTPEELKGESYGYCYGSSVVIPPPEKDESSL